MKLTAGEIQDNFDEFLNFIYIYISEPRREKLTNFYLKHQEEIMFMPASL